MRPWMCSLGIALLLAGLATAAEPEPPDSPLAPEDELATFELADKRLTVELVAAEPEVDSPVAICWDADARMYVAEMIDYPTGPPGGRIRMLEDRDNDGRYEHATVYASGLPFPAGVLAAHGGLVVTAAPDLLFLKDDDGDGVADRKIVVYTGFGEGNQQLRANGLTWGIDNWVYGANGRSDGEIHKPDNAEGEPVSIRGRDFRVSLDGRRFEAVMGQSQFGQASDDWGERFLSWNTIPIRHVLFDQAFVDRNPRLASYAVRDIAEASETGEVFPISPRPQTFNSEPTDYYNALSGLTIYRGDALGRDYEDSAFVGESLTNLVHRRALSPDGPTFVSRRGEYDREFLAARDPWFRPVYLTTGPEGALYIVDFYRRWVEHPAFVAKSKRDDVDWREGAGHGRIWKVSRRENTWPPKPQPRLSRATTAELVQQLESPGGWRRDTAHRLLVERNDAAAAALLRTLIAESDLPQAKVHALSIMQHLGRLEDGLLVRGIEDGDARVRRFAMRMAAPRLPKSQRLRETMLGLVDFPSPLVRFELARALAEIEGPDKVEALVRLADLEIRDEPISIAVVGSLGRSAGSFLNTLFDKHDTWRRNPSQQQVRLLREAAATAADGTDDAQLTEAFRLIMHEAPSQVGPGDLAILAGIARGLEDRGHALRKLVDDPPERLRQYEPPMRTLIAAARAMAAGQDETLEHRQLAVEVLGLVDSGSGPTLLALLDPRHDQALQTSAAEALGTADDATAQEMFTRWKDWTTATRRALATAALRSRATTAALVDAIEREDILPRELDPATRDALAAVRDPAIEPRIEKLLAAQAAAHSREEVVDRFTASLDRMGERARGAALFEKHCLGCHTVQSRGHRVGPDLSGIASRSKEDLLVDLFDPSRQLVPQYAAYTLLTHNGQVLSGVLVSETATSVTLRRAEGAQDFVPREQIAELRATGKSLMPDGMEQQLNETDVADLLAFLQQPDARLFSKRD
ncbi:MAG: hypothetical protein DWQ37_17365 [Planctomycetota bacterium]|nr:MAG: hypothetical protein DWQ37_17365 [Planctomycetota bacterium]